MITKKHYVLTALMTIGLAGLGAQAYAAHSGGDVQLLDAAGQPLGAGSTAPYSPKQTCSSTQCHLSGSFPTFTGHDYESSWNTAAKTQHNSSGVKVAYEVPYPEHGASSGYHFQQGRNIDWDDTQRAVYKVGSYTSSPGMYGKY